MSRASAYAQSSTLDSGRSYEDLPLTGPTSLHSSTSQPSRPQLPKPAQPTSSAAEESLKHPPLIRNFEWPPGLARPPKNSNIPVVWLFSPESSVSASVSLASASSSATSYEILSSQKWSHLPCWVRTPDSEEKSQPWLSSPIVGCFLLFDTRDRQSSQVDLQLGVSLGKNAFRLVKLPAAAGIHVEAQRILKLISRQNSNQPFTFAFDDRPFMFLRQVVIRFVPPFNQLLQQLGHSPDFIDQVSDLLEADVVEKLLFSRQIALVPTESASSGFGLLIYGRKPEDSSSTNTVKQIQRHSGLKLSLILSCFCSIHFSMYFGLNSNLQATFNQSAVFICNSISSVLV